VILTVRDPAHWFESAWGSIFPRIMRPVAEGDEVGRRRARMQRQLIVERTFGGDIESAEHAQAVFLRHNETVKRAVARERLLVGLRGRAGLGAALPLLRPARAG
jgi:hypothetical protein